MIGDDADAASVDSFGVLLQYPDTFGAIHDYKALADAVHARGGLVAVATDLLALTLIAAPGEWGADIVVGNSQRFGVPFGFGGPHAAFMACRDAYKRSMPGRLIGVSIDAEGKPAYRLTLQTREQHIRREKATSNICTAQVLLAVMASMYAVYHGPEGLTRIARRTHRLAAILAGALRKAGVARRRRTSSTRCTSPASTPPRSTPRPTPRASTCARSTTRSVGISLDETTTREDVVALAGAVRRRASTTSTRSTPPPPTRCRPSLLRTVEVPAAPGVQHPPQRARTAALHARAGRQGPGDGSHHDPAGQLHDEAQRHRRDDPGDLAGVRQHPSAGAGRRRPRATRS